MTRAPFRACALLVALTVLSADRLSGQTVDDIVSKNLAAKGGVELIRATNSVRMTGTAALSDGQKVTLTMSAKRPNLIRRDASITDPARGEQVVIDASDGVTVWRKMGPTPARRLEGADAADAQQESQFDSVFVDYKQQGTAIELAENESLNGRSVHHLKVTRKGGPMQHYYLDAGTGLEAKVTTEAQRGGVMMTVVTELSDYRKVDGRTLPFRMRQLVNGSVVADISFQKVEFNVPLEDAFFRMPAPVR